MPDKIVLEDNHTSSRSRHRNLGLVIMTRIASSVSPTNKRKLGASSDLTDTSNLGTASQASIATTTTTLYRQPSTTSPLHNHSKWRTYPQLLPHQRSRTARVAACRSMGPRERRIGSYDMTSKKTVWTDRFFYDTAALSTLPTVCLSASARSSRPTAPTTVSGRS